MNTKILVLVSGGLDSAAVLAFTLAKAKIDEDIIAMSFLFGNKRNRQEIRSAKQLCKHYKIKHVIVDLKGLYALCNTTKYRNGVLISIAASYASHNEIGTIVSGVHADDADSKFDACATFIETTSEAIKIGTNNQIELIAPLKRMEKAQVCGLAANLNVPFEYTYSCSHGGEMHCGVCKSCADRRKAFRLIAIEDITDYESG